MILELELKSCFGCNEAGIEEDEDAVEKNILLLDREMVVSTVLKSGFGGAGMLLLLLLEGIDDNKDVAPVSIVLKRELDAVLLLLLLKDDDPGMLNAPEGVYDMGDWPVIIGRTQ